MEQLIGKIFELSIKLEEIDSSGNVINSKWVGNPSAFNDIISEVENKLEISFPEDYKELLSVTNGYLASDASLEPSFMKIQEVDYLKNIDPFIINCYEDTLKELEDSILVGGRNEEQQFLLIPPKHEKGGWEYWKFANWIPGEVKYDNLKDYLNDVLTFF